MALTPGYGETPLFHDELSALRPGVAAMLGDPITKAAVYDFEQGIQDTLAAEFLPAVADGSLPLEELLSDHFVRDLHARMYEELWNWGGQLRRLELNIGVAPEQIAVALRTSLDDIAFRWTHTDDWTPRQLGIAVHAEVVRIHPFVDGNGRSTRFLADLVFAAAQEPTVAQYNWDIDKGRYIDLLRAYDRHRNVDELAAFVGVEPT
ncbi:Fic family protein [Jongsikchunia kroppenstedtii]|uniref:Fic family protein n=1 Tax=Jongsikchunia kroppenstedtii TaxID=1121721 RepID=UPI00035F30D6|nr:Fic family protein [Jongsikchunia kroppenstedtii]